MLELLWPRWRMARNAPRSGQIGPGKIATFAAFGLIIWGSVYAGSEWFLGRCLGIEPIGELLVEKLLDLTLVVMASMLGFSHVITAFTTFYLSEDLPLFLTRPVAPEPLYSARLVETCALSAWMPLLFGLPVFLAAGRLFGAPWWYYGLLPAALLPLSVMAGSLAVLLTLALTNLMPAQRTRDVLVFLGVLASVVVFILIRAINPEELFSTERFANTMELFATLQSPQSPWLPSTLAWEVITGALRGESLAWRPLWGLWSAAASLYFLGAWGFRRWHAAGYSRALEGRHGGGGLERAAGLVGGWSAAGPEAMRRALDALRAREGRLRLLPEMLRKDLRIFLRDTAQWSQLLLLGALIIIYLLNFRYLRAIGEGGIIGPMGLFVMNLGLCGFVVAAVGARFLFPAISLEGRGFWVLKASPQPMRAILVSKWVAGGLPLLLMSELLTVLSNLLIGAPWPLALAGLVIVASMNVGISGLAVGMGALFPRFDIENAARIASTFGGVLYMLSGMGLMVVVVLLSLAPAWALFHLTQAPDSALPSAWLGWALASLAALLLLPPALGLGMVRLGARALSR
jgi:ABC-2 type transport system permease protein